MITGGFSNIGGFSMPLLRVREGEEQGDLGGDEEKEERKKPHYHPYHSSPALRLVLSIVYLLYLFTLINQLYTNHAYNYSCYLTNPI